MTRSLDLPTPSPGFASSAVLMAGSMVAWAAHFTLVYGLVAVVCALGWAGPSILGFGLVDLAVAAATAAAWTATAVLGIAGWRRRGGARPEARFVADVTVLSASLAALAILWSALPAYLVPLCA